MRGIVSWCGMLCFTLWMLCVPYCGLLSVHLCLIRWLVCLIRWAGVLQYCGMLCVLTVCSVSHATSCCMLKTLVCYVFDTYCEILCVWGSGILCTNCELLCVSYSGLLCVRYLWYMLWYVLSLTRAAVCSVRWDTVSLILTTYLYNAYSSINRYKDKKGVHDTALRS